MAIGRYISVLVLLALPAWAGSIVSTFQVTAQDPAGETISARGVFTMDQIAGTLSVQLTNQVTDERSVGQAITGFSFGLTSGLADFNGAFGDQIQVASNGVVSDLGRNPQATLSDWRTTTSGRTVTVTDLGKGQPKLSILGAATDGVYRNANGSIAGNKAHNSFVSEVATFTFRGVTGNLVADSVRIGFGTEGTNYVVASLVPEMVPFSSSISNVGFDSSAPEPGTWCFALAGLGWLGYRRRRGRWRSPPIH